METQELQHLAVIAIRQAQLGTWHRNLDTGEFIASPRLKEIFGFRADEPAGFDDVINRIHSDYRPLVLRLIEQTIAGDEDHDIEYPLSIPGKRKSTWVRAIGVLTKMESNGQSCFMGTVMDITEQKEHDLRQNNFINMASHELKTPLTTLAAYLQLLERRLEDYEDEQSATIIGKVQAQVWKMNDMIDGFLNMNRPDAGKLVLTKTDFDLAELLHEIEEDLQATVSSHDLSFPDMVPTYIHADRERISQVLHNLINNALKYSSPGLPVTISFVDREDSVQLNVKDLGYGIDRADQPHLFDRYYRAKNPRTKHVQGFGIGLYLCEEIVQQHQGKIWVESEPNKGATFSFIIPKA